MPYYYLGYLTQAVIAKATAVEPAVAYNLAVASVLALAAVGAMGLGSGLVYLRGASTRIALLVGALGAFGLTVMGNLEAFFEILAAQRFGDAAFWANIGIKNLQANNGPFPPADGGWWFRAGPGNPEHHRTGSPSSRTSASSSATCIHTTWRSRSRY